MLTPVITSVAVTPSGCRTLTARYPLAVAIHAARLPDIRHDGVHYVPHTGRLVRTGEGRGLYMEYRAIREVA